MKRVLFLCTGNYYRSRFAEIFFNWHAQQRGLSWAAESRGLALNPWLLVGYYLRLGGPISKHTISSLTARGIPSDDRRLPLPVSEADLAAADHIVAVKETEHRPLMETRFPSWRDEVEYWHVHDLDCALPDDAIPHLEREILGLIDRLAA